MKKLFEVNGQYFPNKSSAKVERDSNGGAVHKGPEHKDFTANTKTHYGSSGHKENQSNGDGFRKKRY